MKDGSITNNISSSSGGGVHNNRGTFTKTDGSVGDLVDVTS